jgi:DNA-binding GntR family transcriptional regulator
MLPQQQSVRPVVSTRKLARHEVRRVLRQRILEGKCRAGTKLVQGQLAKDFGVSIGVVREALLELQAWGLVETKDNHGVTVRGWNLERLLESYDIREMLEGLSARLCCGRLDSGSHDNLHHLAEQILQANEKDDWDTSCRLDREFHHQILQLSANRTLLRLTDCYLFLGKMMWWGRPGTIPAETFRAHLEILNAIHLNHPDEAERAAREHVAIARRSIAELAAKGEFEPHWLT